MRSKNFSDIEKTFTPLAPNQMVRVALVDGIKPNHPISGNYDLGFKVPGRLDYSRLLQDYLEIESGELHRLWDLLGQDQYSEREREQLDSLVGLVAYDSKRWKRFDYEKLKKEGVIIEHNGQDLPDLVSLMEGMGENQVVFIPTLADIQSGNEVDYEKHISHRNTLYLNGIQSVRAFAERKGLTLPDKYTSSFPMRQDVFDLLFRDEDPNNILYFMEALHSSIDALTNDPRLNKRVIARVGHKTSDGTLVTWQSHDDVESGELFSYFLEHDRSLVDRLGTMVEGGDKYFGEVVIDVPKRTPMIRDDGSLETHNKVVFHYWPDITGKRHPEDWMNTDPFCIEPDAQDRRNYEDRTSEKMVRIPRTHDLHTMLVSLARVNALKIPLSQAVNNFSPVATPDYSQMVDKFRYNIAYEIPQTDKAPVRKYVGEVGLRILIHELWKKPDWTFDRMFNPRHTVGDSLLRPMYK